jgi:hypothetical protein
LIDPGWQQSLSGAAMLAVLSIVCAPMRSRMARLVVGFSREFSLVLVALAMWQRIGVYVHTRVAGAEGRAESIYHLERVLGLPNELAVQHASMHWSWMIQFLNLYYGLVHLNSMAMFLVWLWWKRPDAYFTVRYAVILSTLACFLIQIVPVAPPRMMVDLGFVDAAMEYGESVYGQFGESAANQLAAMPSIHLDWAVIVGFYFFKVGPRGWRWAGPIHIGLTTWAVVATGNHWWADGIIAAALVVLSLPAGSLVRQSVIRMVARWQSWAPARLPRWAWPFAGIEGVLAPASE